MKRTFGFATPLFSSSRGDSAGPFELDVFRGLNGLPAFLAFVLWLPMQFGNFLILPLGAVGALVGKQWRLAAAFAIAGVGKYGFARMIKDEFVRHRPAVFLDDVQVGFGGSDSGLGFVSGHAIVAVAFATDGRSGGSRGRRGARAADELRAGHPEDSGRGAP